MGIAVSDPLRVVARPLTVVPTRIRGGAAAEISRIARENGAGHVVIGLPLLPSGEEGERARASRALGRRVAASDPDLGVEFWDERYSSREAERRVSSDVRDPRERRDRVDAVAAALILQSWLDARR